MKDSIIHIHFAKIDFNCPHCNKSYQDSEDKYLDKCNSNKSGFTKIKCECGEWFGMTYDIQGAAVGFKLEQNESTVSATYTRGHLLLNQKPANYLVLTGT